MSTSSSSHTSQEDHSASTVDHEPITFDEFSSLLVDSKSGDRKTSDKAWQRLDRISPSLKFELIHKAYCDINTPDEIKKCALDLIVGMGTKRIDLEYSIINQFLGASSLNFTEELRFQLAETIGVIGREIVEGSDYTEHWSELVEWFHLHATTTPFMYRFSLRIIDTYALIFGPESALVVPFIAKSIEHTDAVVRSTAFSTLGGVVRWWAMGPDRKEHMEKLAELIPTLVQLAQADASEGGGTPRWCMDEVASSYDSLRAHLDPYVARGLQAILDTTMAHREYTLALLDSLLSQGWRDEIVNGDTILSLCRDLLTSVKNETDDKIRSQLTVLISTVAGHTIDSQTHEQQWKELAPFLIESSVSADSRMRSVAITVLSHTTEVFGKSGRGEAAILLKRALEDTEKDIRSTAIEAYRCAISNRSIDELVPIAILILKIAIGDPSMDEASPRSRLIEMSTNEWYEFSPILRETAVAMGDEFIPVLSFLLPSLIETAKKIPDGPVCACSSSKRDEACPLITFFAQQFPVAFKPYVQAVWAVVMFHFATPALEKNRAWAAEVAPLLLASLKVAGEVAAMGTMFSEYWKALQKAVDDEKKPGGIKRIPAYISSIVKFFECHEDVTDETVLEMEDFVATELDGAKKRQQEREVKGNKNKIEEECDTKIINGAKSLSRIIRLLKYRTKREAALAQ